jgi:uncharacterized protein YkwD
MRNILIATMAIIIMFCFLFPREVGYETGEFLYVIAEEKMDDLIRTGYFEHENSNGCDFKCRIKDYRSEYTWIGENLYKGECDIRTAMEMWEKSPSHKYILDHSYTNEVVLSREYKEGYCYIVLMRAEL